MICMRITKNGKVWTVMGHETVDLLMFQMHYTPGAEEAMVMSFGSKSSENGTVQPVQWIDADSTISTYDRISIDFVDTEQPDSFSEIAVGESVSSSNAAGDNEIRCSFCGRDKIKAGNVIAGPDVFICGACVAVCNEILQKNENSDN
jgi:hypothetical protein